MNDAVFRFGDFLVYGFGLLALVSFLWGSFVFYKKAVESHIEEHRILDAVIMAGFWSLVLGRVFYVIFNWSTFGSHLLRVLMLSDYPGVNGLGAVTGLFVGVYWLVRKTKGRVFDWFDLLSLGILSGASWFYVGLLLLGGSRWYVLGVLSFWIGFILAWRMEFVYRTYGWYRGGRTSARSGLITGIMILTWGLYLFLYALIETFSWWEGLAGLFLFVAGPVLVYIRSGRTAREDIKIILSHVRKQKN